MVVKEALLAALLCGWACVATAGGDYRWKVTSDDKAEAAAESSQFTGNEVDETLAIWWKEWKAEYGKTYSSPAEEAAARNNFRQTLRKVHTANVDPDTPYVSEVNQFADMDWTTFKQKMLMQFDPRKYTARKMLDASEMFNPEEEDQAELGDLQPRGRKLLGTLMDWRAKWKVTPIKYQGQCGSCWAFAATGAIESAYHIVKGTNASSNPINLSEQQLVSCATAALGYGSAGCNGGYSDKAIQYVYNINQTTEARYPYSATTGTCNKAIVAGPAGSAVRLNGTVKYVPSKNQTLLMYAVNKQPVVAYFDVESGFYSYRSGVFKPSYCNYGINHAMLIVGYYWSGTSSTSYWIVKNSWGTSWGEKGYVRVQMTGDGQGPCMLYTYPLVPVLSFTKTLY